MDIAESLAQLDPLNTYRKRGAEQVGRAAKAASYRVRSAAGDAWEEAPGADRDPDLSIALRFRREKIGVIDLYLRPMVRLSREELRVVRWAGRLYARGLNYVTRLGPGACSPSESITSSLRDAPLTPREREVVHCLASGASTRDIAAAMQITTQSVNTYLKRIYAKTGTHSRVELLARLVPWRVPDKT